jgi:hypothetical protein
MNPLVDLASVILYYFVMVVISPLLLILYSSIGLLLLLQFSYKVILLFAHAFIQFFRARKRFTLRHLLFAQVKN